MPLILAFGGVLVPVYDPPPPPCFMQYLRCLLPPLLVLCRSIFMALSAAAAATAVTVAVAISVAMSVSISVAVVVIALRPLPPFS